MLLPLPSIHCDVHCHIASMLIRLVSPGTNDRLTLGTVAANIGTSKEMVGHVNGASCEGSSTNGHDWVGPNITEPNLGASHGDVLFGHHGTSVEIAAAGSSGGTKTRKSQTREGV